MSDESLRQPSPLQDVSSIGSNATVVYTTGEAGFEILVPKTVEERLELNNEVARPRRLYWPSRCPACGHNRFTLRESFTVQAGQEYLPNCIPIWGNLSRWLVCTNCGADCPPRAEVT